MQHGIKRTHLSKEARQDKYERDAIKITTYRGLTATIFQRRTDSDFSTEALELTTNLLNLNPEFYSVWNYRREILLDLIAKEPGSKKTRLEYDLKMIMAFLRRYPKCYWIWNHRVWCLQELAASNEVNWAFELGIVSKLLELDARNYHGWQYRRFVVESMEGSKKQNASNDDEYAAELLDITFKEYQYTTTKINNNISNFSAWHNRSKVIPKLYKLWKLHGQTQESDQYRELVTTFQSPYSILIHELELIKTGMYMDADDTSIWLYLQWLLTDELFVDDLSKRDEDGDDGKKSYRSILNEELDIIEELNELEKDDHPENKDHIWCLKSIIVIKKLIAKELVDQEQKSKVELEIKEAFEKLIELDLIRKGRYIEQLRELREEIKSV